MPEAETIKYPVADCIKMIVEKMIDPITTTSEWHFLNNLLAQLFKLQTGDYGRNRNYK